MTINELKKSGRFLFEQDMYNNTIYAGTKYYYEYQNALYCREEPTNQLSYTGKISTYLCVENIREDLKKYNFEYWNQMLSQDNYTELCVLYNVKPKF